MKWIATLGLGCTVIAGLAHLGEPLRAEEILPGPIPARAEKVIDGDTIEVVAAIWPGLATRARVRLSRIDAPELTSPCDAARAKALEARAVLENAVKGVALRLVNIRPEHAFGRILADVQLADGSDLGELLLSVGLAKPYARKVRCDWCAAAPRCSIALN
jgi:micrococcal nuclease